MRPHALDVHHGDADSTREGALLLDGHVHLHGCFGVETFLDSAVRNFRRGAWELGLEPPFDGCLLFTERSGDDFFARLERSGRIVGAKRWAMSDTGEPSSLRARRDDGATLLLVAGHQIVTREGLEVLALGCMHDFPEGQPLDTIFSEVESVGGIPVLPWGVGKWHARRGEIVASVLHDSRRASFFLGDNSGRPVGTPMPKLFRLAAACGVRILPGSDPLPLPWEESNVGRYGFVLENFTGSERPAESIVRALRESRTQPRLFGRREGWGGFARSQIALRWRKNDG